MHTLFSNTLSGHFSGVDDATLVINLLL